MPKADLDPTVPDDAPEPPPTAAPGRSSRAGARAKPLVIVESPAKAKTIAGLLGPDYLVESSIGHIRDLPRRADEVPAAYKGEAWSRLGVDVDNGFKPLYIVSSEKKSQVAKLKQLVKQASEVYLASDEDREGESIAWHLLEVLAPTVPVKRMVFHEITRPAIERAVHEWRELDRRLVDAQEARRILDRLYGYEVSPVLWKKIMPRLSAGRVQSVATRMVVERERVADQLPIGRLVGHRRLVHRDPTDRPRRSRRAPSVPRSWRSTTWPWPRVATSTTPASCASPAPWSCSTSRGPVPSPPGSRTSPSRCARSPRSRSGGRRRLPS